MVDTHSLMVCKVSSQHSQSKFDKLLEDFIKSNCYLLFLTASVQDVTEKMVNHLRVIVEEAESQIKNTNKLFVLLLHFPPAMFFDPCYSSLFLQGWDHHYLDGKMVAALECMLEDAVPVIASRSVLKTGTNASQRTNLISDLLLKKRIGIVLSQRFAKYWNPQTMVELIQKVSSFTYSQKSTPNISDAIRTTFRSLFFDFLVYMFGKINADCNLGILLDEQCTLPTLDLFLSLLETVPVPDLKSLRATIIPSSPKESSYHPKFPFFKYVCEAMHKCIDESIERVNQGTWPNLLQGNTDQLQEDMEASIAMSTTSLHPSTIDVHRSKQLMEEMYCKEVKLRIKVRQSMIVFHALSVQLVRAIMLKL